MELSSKLDGEFPESIVVGVTQATIDVCDNPNPGTVYEAKFSVQHCVSVAVLSGKVGFDSFESEARKLTAPLNRKITLHCDGKIEQRYPEAWGAEIKAEMKDGNVIIAHRDNAKGDPDSPLSPKEMKEKAVMLFFHAGIEKPLESIEKILCIHNESSFSENDLYHLLDLKA